MLTPEAIAGRVRETLFHWAGVCQCSQDWKNPHEEMILAWLLLFFMTTNDLTVVFSLGQSAGSVVFLLRRPLSSLLIILMLTPPPVYVSLHKSSWVCAVAWFTFLFLTAGICTFLGFLWFTLCLCGLSPQLEKWEGHRIYAQPGTVYFRFKVRWRGPVFKAWVMSHFLTFHQCRQIPVKSPLA